MRTLTSAQQFIGTEVAQFLGCSVTSLRITPIRKGFTVGYLTGASQGWPTRYINGTGAVRGLVFAEIDSATLRVTTAHNPEN